MKTILSVFVVLFATTYLPAQPSDEDFKLIGSPPVIHEVPKLTIRSLDAGILQARRFGKPLFVAKNVIDVDYYANEAEKRGGVFAIADPKDPRVDDGFTEVVIDTIIQDKPKPTPVAQTNSANWHFDAATGTYWQYTAPPVTYRDYQPVYYNVQQPQMIQSYDYGGFGFGAGFNIGSFGAGFGGGFGGGDCAGGG